MNYDFDQHPDLKKYIENVLSFPEVREANKDFFALLGHMK